MANVIAKHLDNRCLLVLGQAKQLLAEARSIEDVKALRDQAEIAVQRAKRECSGEIQNAAAEIKLRAERRLGQLLAVREMDKGGRPKTGDIVSPVSKPKTLKELGIEKKESERWQRAASVPEQQFEQHVATVKSGGELTTAGVMKLAKEIEKANAQADAQKVSGDTCIVADLHRAVELGKKFGTIYADPPWQYGNQATRSATDNEYKTMPFEEIMALPVAELAADKSHLHLWTTCGFIKEALLLVEKWEFEYKSMFVWIKPSMGIGNYWRLTHEIMLLGVRGSLAFLDHGQKSWDAWLPADREVHSKKPAEIRRIIEKTSPGPRLELFARNSFPGWTVWGNGVKQGVFEDGLFAAESKADISFLDESPDRTLFDGAEDGAAN